jgi:hypothetical protein
MMTANPKLTVAKRWLFTKAGLLTSLGLFLLALIPRALDLQRFVTADEAKWVYRSAQFLAALLQGDFAATEVNLTPAVTTTWLGSLGLAIYYHMNRAIIQLPFTDWLLSLPEFRVELPILSATRWPMALFTSLGLVVIYGLARRLFNPTLAFVAVAFMALDPHLVALSRILGHDAPAAICMPLSILLLSLALGHSRPEADRAAGQPGLAGPSLSLIILSGLSAGLAFLSKAPALFLIPFSGLLFAGQLWRAYNGRRAYNGWRAALYFWAKCFISWSLAAYLTFVMAWPAAWLDPLGRPLAVAENAFLSATDEEEAESEHYWATPDLGYFYYLVNGVFKLSPLALVGVGLALAAPFIERRKKTQTSDANRDDDFKIKAVQAPPQSPIPSPLPPISPAPLLWLAIFVLLFTIFMTLGDKRSPRYLLPIFPALALIAAHGWLKLYQLPITNYQLPITNYQLPNLRFTFYVLRFAFPATLTLSAILILLPYHPYYFSYFNPLLGGGFTAPHLVKIGWGEGLDRVGRFLQRELPGSRVGTPYASTVAPFFKGNLAGLDAGNLDYLVFYRKQLQSGEPSPAIIRYFEQTGSIFSVELNGIHYADVYPGPAVQPPLSLTPGLDAPVLPRPIGFRPLSVYGHIGQPLTVDVLWLAEEPLPTAPSVVTLQPLDTLNSSRQAHQPGPMADRTGSQAPPILAEGQGRLTRLADDLIVSRHHLATPADLERGTYTLWLDGQPLGEIEFRHFQTPPGLPQVEDTIFEQQIALTGFQFTPADDYVSLTIAWQARQTPLPDYTVFAQLLETETDQRMAGVDTQPLAGQAPTSRWLKGEVIIDTYQITLPPDFPAGFYKLIVGWYKPETGQRLILNNGADHWVVPWTFIRKDR